MSMQGPGGARFPFAMTGHLMVGEEYLSQLLLSMSMHPCNRVTLFCGDRRKGELILESGEHPASQLVKHLNAHLL